MIRLEIDNNEKVLSRLFNISITEPVIKTTSVVTRTAVYTNIKHYRTISNISTGLTVDIYKMNTSTNGTGDNYLIVERHFSRKVITKGVTVDFLNAKLIIYQDTTHHKTEPQRILHTKTCYLNERIDGLTDSSSRRCARSAIRSAGMVSKLPDSEFIVNVQLAAVKRWLGSLT